MEERYIKMINLGFLSKDYKNNNNSHHLNCNGKWKGLGIQGILYAVAVMIKNKQ
jgi:hypothetical protein